MGTRSLLCKSTACKAVAPYTRCTWKGRVQLCILSNVVNVSEGNKHVSPLRPTRRAHLTEKMKAFARDMCAYNHKPMNMYNGIVIRFQVGEATMPTLAMVQRFVQHFRRTNLGESDFHDDVTAKMRKAGSLREVSPEKHSIGFLTGAMTPATNTNVVHAVSDRMERVYDPQDRRTKEALPVTACVSTQKARMETAGMPGSGWEVDVDLKICGCRIFFKSGYCIHLIHALSVRNRLDIFCRTRLVYRGRNKARRAQTEQQNTGRPANNGRALQLD
ncbi:hypothetical protein PPTG_18578 [Phytophthora nicotianae INRA-310]|uniref:SWIM-type domain-containing protein n=1 Tax=Phytophthora nicotianae (strain INRA-310) TaxID=761204 RepID=W2PGM0_PHYN3|nr:hypothetical protein PPTG_18578 [Phytophthora nicotianae INRA-310]ETM99353.1 hypothetical protein PPTG_18578 [Phytophthora nicotianae INRA-310]